MNLNEINLGAEFELVTRNATYPHCANKVADLMRATIGYREHHFDVSLPRQGKVKGMEFTTPIFNLAKFDATFPEFARKIGVGAGRLGWFANKKYHTGGHIHFSHPALVGKEDALLALYNSDRFESILKGFREPNYYAKSVQGMIHMPDSKFYEIRSYDRSQGHFEWRLPSGAIGYNRIRERLMFLLEMVAQVI
jgi:hypothetical protein